MDRSRLQSPSVTISMRAPFLWNLTFSLLFAQILFPEAFIWLFRCWVLHRVHHLMQAARCWTLRIQQRLWFFSLIILLILSWRIGGVFLSFLLLHIKYSELELEWERTHKCRNTLMHPLNIKQTLYFLLFFLFIPDTRTHTCTHACTASRPA